MKQHLLLSFYRGYDVMSTVTSKTLILILPEALFRDGLHDIPMPGNLAVHDPLQIIFKCIHSPREIAVYLSFRRTGVQPAPDRVLTLLWTGGISIPEFSELCKDTWLAAGEENTKPATGTSFKKCMVAGNPLFHGYLEQRKGR